MARPVRLGHTTTYMSIHSDWSHSFLFLYTSSVPNQDQLSIGRLWDLSILIKSLNFSASLNTLSVQVKQNIYSAPGLPRSSTLTSHRACCYFPQKVGLFLCYRMNDFVFLSLHKTLCSLRGLASHCKWEQPWPCSMPILCSHSQQAHVLF